MFAAMIRRSTFRPAMSCSQPPPSWPSRLPAGTTTSSNQTSLTSLPPIVSMLRISIPSALVGTSIIEIPSCLEPLASVRQMSRMRSATCAALIQVLCPVRRYVSPSRTALHFSAPTSEPASGSLIAIAMTSPRAIAPSMSRFCSSVPKRSYAPATIRLTLIPAIGSSPWVDSSSSRQRSTTPLPAPPYCSGIAVPA